MLVIEALESHPKAEKFENRVVPRTGNKISDAVRRYGISVDPIQFV